MKSMSLMAAVLLYAPVMAMDQASRLIGPVKSLYVMFGAEDVNKQDEQGRTCLHQVILAQTHEDIVPIVERLLCAGAMVNVCDKNLCTPLHYAAEKRLTGVVKLLLGANAATALMSDLAGMTPMHYAAQSGDVESVKLFYTYSPLLIRYRNRDGQVPLQLAIYAGQYSVVEFLLEKHDRPSQSDEFVHSLLRYALMRGISLDSYIKMVTLNPEEKKLKDTQRAEIISLLARWGVDINRCVCAEKCPPIHYAAMYGDLPNVIALLKNGACIDGKDKQGATPLHLASRYGHIQVALKLIGAGALITTDSHNRTALHYAAANGRIDIVKALVAKDPLLMKISDEQGMSPLFLAVRAQRYPVAKLLLDKGAEVLAKDEHKRVPFHYAASLTDEKMMKLLSRKSLKCITVCDEEERTPLEYAVQVKKASRSSFSPDYLREYIDSLIRCPYQTMLAFLMGLQPQAGAESPVSLLLNPAASPGKAFRHSFLNRLTKLIKK